MPSPCIVCARNCNEVISICKFCCNDLPWIKNACYACGLPLPDSGLHANHCAKCLLHPPSINFCQGIFHYESPISRLITRFKFHDQFEIGFSLSFLLAGEIEKEYAGISQPEFLIPVPLHRERLRVRGFNQAFEISKVISQQTSIPIGLDFVKKVRNTSAQTELDSASKRRRSQKNVFCCDKNRWPENVNHVAIIDDVVTTMATVLSLASSLESHGVRHIDVWCLARATL